MFIPQRHSVLRLLAGPAKDKHQALATVIAETVIAESQFR